MRFPFLTLLLTIFDIVSFAQPKIESFSPASAKQGETIVISGTGFKDVTAVYFNEIPALSFQVVNNLEIRAVVAGGATGKISVWTKNGLAEKTGFVYSGIPAFTEVGPTNGLPHLISFSGTGFNNLLSVKIAGQNFAFADILGTKYMAISTPVRGDLVAETPAGIVTHPSIGYTTIHYIDHLTGLPGDTIEVYGFNLDLVQEVFIGPHKLTRAHFENFSTMNRYVLPEAPIGFSAPVKFFTAYQTIESSIFTFNIAPRIFSFFPRETIAGDSVTIYGKNLNQATGVKIGGSQTGFSILDDSQIRVQVGGNASSGTIEVETVTGITRKAGFVRNPLRITNVSPNTAGYGDLLSISGPLLGNVQEVLFGSNPSKSLAFTQAGPQNVGVQIWEELQSPIRIRNEFEISEPFTNVNFIRKPYIDSIVPAKAKPGEEVTFYVKNVTNPSNVSFNGVAGNILSFDGTRIVVRTPNGYRGEVTLNCLEGMVYTQKFTLVKKPVINKFTPGEGGVGDSITIVGDDFDLVDKVFVGLIPMENFRVISKDTIRFTLGGALSKGTFPITIKDRKDSATANYFHFFLPPMLYSQEILIGSEGSLVNLKGSNFDGPLSFQALFNGIVSPRLHIRSDSSVFAEVPAGAQSGEIIFRTKFGSGNPVQFIFKAPPRVDSLYPAFAAAGELVTVSGKNFALLPGYDFRLLMNSLKIEPETVSDTEITFKMPEYASSGHITIQTNGYSIESRHSVNRIIPGTGEVSLNLFGSYKIRTSNLMQSRVAFADLDGDQKPELIRFSHFDSEDNFKFKLTWQKNLSDLYHFQFGPEMLLFDSSGHCCLTPGLDVGDINNDGRPDILITLGDNGSTTVKIFYHLNNQGTPSFQKFESIFYYRHFDPKITDLDKDGFPDFVIFGKDYTFGVEREAYLWFYNPFREINPFKSQIRSTLLEVPSFMGSVKIDYMNADIRPEYIIGNSIGKISTSANKPFVLGYTPSNADVDLYQSSLRDLDGDGLADVISNINYADSNRVYKNTGNTSIPNGLLQQKVSFLRPRQPISLVTNDFNSDGNIDLLFFGGGSPTPKTNADSIYIFKGTGIPDQFNFQYRMEPTNHNLYTEEVLTGDYNADGRPDMLLVQSGSNFKELNFLVNAVHGVLHSSGCASGSRAITVLGRGKKHQWQIFQNGAFTNITNTQPFGGATSHTLTISSLSPAILSSRFRCIVDNVATPEYTVRIRNEFKGPPTGNRLWSDPANWSCGVIPDINSDAIINGLEVIIDQPASCRHINLKNGAKITLQNGAILDIRD